MTKVDPKTDHEWHELKSRAQRSIRYHRSRELFFNRWSNTGAFLSLLAGSSVVVSILAQFPEWAALAAGASVALLQTLELVLRLGERARLHSSLASDFAAIERIMVTEDIPSRQMCRDLHAQILTIETREPPIMRYLDLVCHNQVARADGSDDVEQLSWWQFTFRHYLAGDKAMERS